MIAFQAIWVIRGHDAPRVIVFATVQDRTPKALDIRFSPFHCCTQKKARLLEVDTADVYRGSTAMTPHFDKAELFFLDSMTEVNLATVSAPKPSLRLLLPSFLQL